MRIVLWLVATASANTSFGFILTLSSRRATLLCFSSSIVLSAIFNALANIRSGEKEAPDQSGQFTLAANVTDNETGADITIVGSSLVFTQDADSVVAGQNLALFKGIFSGTSAAESAVSFDAKQYTYSNLAVTQSVAIMSETLLVMVLPIVLIIAGIVIWYRRRRA